jgi:hypothetical protein
MRHSFAQYIDEHYWHCISPSAMMQYWKASHKRQQAERHTPLSLLHNRTLFE